MDNGISQESGVRSADDDDDDDDDEADDDNDDDDGFTCYNGIMASVRSQEC